MSKAVNFEPQDSYADLYFNRNPAPPQSLFKRTATERSDDEFDDRKNALSALMLLQFTIAVVSIVGMVGAITTLDLSATTVAFMVPHFFVVVGRIIDGVKKKNWEKVCLNVVAFLLVSSVLAINAYSISNRDFLFLYDLSTLNLVASVSLLAQYLYERRDSRED